MLRLGLFATLMVLFVTLQAQTLSIKGILQDKTEKIPVSGATLKLTIQQDSLNAFNLVSDRTGAFEFKNLLPNTYLLVTTSIGHEPDSQVVILTDSSKDLGIIGLSKRAKLLESVTVKVTVPPVMQKGDTTQFSASQYKVNPDATTEDLIKKMPGIVVEKDGTVTAQGEQVRKVTIDGKDFFGDDASAALRNLPSDIVDKIQLFDRLSDQAQFTGIDDGNSVKALNIITKSGLKNGQFGRVYAGFGTDSRYAAGGNVSTFSGDRRISVVGNFNNINQQNFGSQDLLGVTSSGGAGRGGGGGNFGGRGGNRGGGGAGRGGAGRGGGGNFDGGENFLVGQQSGISKTNAIGINYSDKWGKSMEVSGSYFFNNSNNTNENISRAETKLTDGRTLFNNQTSLSQSKNFNHRINLRLEYRIDSSNTIMIIPSLNFQKNRSLSGAFENSLYGLTDTLNTSVSDRNVLRDGYNLRNTILYRHSFPKRGRTFSVSFNTTFNKNDGETYSNAHYRFFEDTGVRDSLQNQFTNNPTSGYSLSGNLSYTEPIGAKSQLQFSYTPSYSKNKADQQTFEYDALGGKYSTFKETLSNKFDNISITHNGGITYRLGNNRDNQFAVGISLQHSKLESERIFPSVSHVNQSFTNVLPNLMWSKKIGARSNMRVFYRASTNFPSVTQLQDVVNNTNELRKSVGNPELKQSYNHFVSGRYTFTNIQQGRSFFANVFLQAQQNYITNATYIAQQDSIIQPGSTLKKGAQLTKPVNMDGYKSFRSFFTFSQPVKFIKSNINLSTGFSYSKLPGLINSAKTSTDNFTYSGGIVVASNVSEYMDFNLSYNVNFNNAKSSIGTNDKYVNQSAGIQTNFLTKSGWFLQNDVSNQSYTGMSDGFNQSYWLWNAAIGKKFLKSRAAEFKLSVFDLLKQNQSINRTVEANYIEDVQSQVLQQYFMLTFTYSLKNFGTGRTPARPMRNGGERN